MGITPLGMPGSKAFFPRRDNIGVDDASIFTLLTRKLLKKCIMFLIFIISKSFKAIYIKYFTYFTLKFAF